MSRIVVASKKPVRVALTVALAIHIALISLQGHRRIDTGFIRVWTLDSLAPLEKLADRSLFGARQAWDRYIVLIGVHEENLRLKRENDDFRMQLTQQREVVAEAERIRVLAGFHPLGIEKPLIARVIARDPAHTQTITIDKGRVHGLKPDTAVITPAGVVGRVIQSSNFFSIVQLIIDSQSAVGVMLQSTRRQGIVKGNGGPELDLDYIDDDNDLKQGDMFLTSGGDRIYPKGMPVGVITSIGARRGLLKAVQVRPSADLGRLEEVLCVIERHEKVDVVDPTQGQPVP
jgi:rod shape-determining protein MreC